MWQCGNRLNSWHKRASTKDHWGHPAKDPHDFALRDIMQRRQHPLPYQNHRLASLILNMNLLLPYQLLLHFPLLVKGQSMLKACLGHRNPGFITAFLLCSVCIKSVSKTRMCLQSAAILFLLLRTTAKAFIPCTSSTASNRCPCLMLCMAGVLSVKYVLLHLK